MKSLIHESVEHKKFGRGSIIKEESGKITVEFNSEAGSKIFQFPETCEQFLIFDDKSIQEESLLQLQAKRQLVVEENERRQQEHERQEEERKKEELEQKKKTKRILKPRNPK